MGFRDNLTRQIYPLLLPVVTNKCRTMAELQQFPNDPFQFRLMKAQRQSTVRIDKEPTNAAVVNVH